MAEDKIKFNHKDVVKQICDFMGEDLDAPACREVAEHLKSCPTCQVQLDTIRRTVTVCREMDDKKQIPTDVNERLFKVLNLDDIKKSHR